LVFFGKEFIFIVKIFWPYRSDPKGFSIQNLARKYREKISGVSRSTISNQLLDDKNLQSLKQDIQTFPLSQISIKKGHWANRDFSEYRDAA